MFTRVGKRFATRRTFRTQGCSAWQILSCLPFVVGARLGPTKLFGGNMLRKSQALMAATFFCLLMCFFTASGHAQGQPQRGGRGAVAVPDGTGKDEGPKKCYKWHVVGQVAYDGGNTIKKWAGLFGTV